MKLTTRWYYTFKDVVKAYNEEEEIGLNIRNFSIRIEHSKIGLIDLLTEMLGEGPALSDSDRSKKMFSDFLWPEYQDSTITYIDKEVNPWEIENEETPEFEDLEDEVQSILVRMMRWIVESKERYEVLIEAYEQIQNNLLAQVKTISESEGLSTQLNEGINSSSVGGSDSSTVAVESVTHGSASSTNTGSESSSGTTANSEESVTTNSAAKVHLENDTPQASWSDGFAADPYVSKMTKDDESGRNVSGSESSGTTSTSGTSSSSGESANNATTSTSTTSTGSNSSTINGSNSSNARGTNSQSSVVGSDVTTPIERLDEVRKKLHNLYADWANEFERFVIYSD